MFEQQIQEIGKKTLAAISAAAAALFTVIVFEIKQYFLKKKIYKKGNKDGHIDEAKIWMERVEEIEKNKKLSDEKKLKELKAIKTELDELKKRERSTQ